MAVAVLEMIMRKNRYLQKGMQIPVIYRILFACISKVAQVLLILQSRLWPVTRPIRGRSRIGLVGRGLGREGACEDLLGRRDHLILFVWGFLEIEIGGGS